jgi:hypothetical protein
VYVFTNRPGFGKHRMPQSGDDLWWKDIVTKSKDAEPTPQPADKQAKGSRKPHYAVRDVVMGNSFAIVDADVVTEQWEVSKVQLIGLLKPKEPVVYVTDKLLDAKDRKDGETRALDAFEKSALKEILSGSDRLVEKRGKQLRLMGAIYAGQKCVTCHEQKGQLLGAFTYELSRVPFKATPEFREGIPEP